MLRDSYFILIRILNNANIQSEIYARYIRSLYEIKKYLISPSTKN